MHRHNPRLVKIHRNYTVEEIAELFSVHKNTVRAWIKQGLPVLDTKKPMLIHGEDLAHFISSQRKKNKKPCGPGEIYCVRCRIPRLPLDLKADYKPHNVTSGNLMGICPICEIFIYRKVSLLKLDMIRGVLSIRMPEGLKHLEEQVHPSVNSDFKE